eukprot:6571383-Heterocapsa_arctica.AAC.1
MGGHGRGIEGRNQRTAETEQPGAARHQGGTENSFVATGVLETQGEGRVQEGDVVPSAEDRFQCEGLSEHERGHPKCLCR